MATAMASLSASLSAAPAQACTRAAEAPRSGFLAASGARHSLEARRPRVRACKATAEARRAAASPALLVRAEGDPVGEVFELELERPYGIKFYRGADGAIYVDALTPGYPAAKSGRIQEGDKLLATSAVFGDEMWPAAEYGRTMYCIQQRVGPMLMRFEKRGGEKIGWYQQDAYLKERAAGNYGDAIKERQAENWAKRVEMREQREEELNSGLALYNGGKYQEALSKFQAIMGMYPEYEEQGVIFYNMACCCAKMGKAREGLEALEGAMKAGFDNYKKIREDPDLSALRDTDEFDELIAQFDEPFINENALKALGSVFGIFGRK